MVEDDWSFDARFSSEKVSREDIMMVLADLNKILIRATPGPNIMEAR